MNPNDLNVNKKHKNSVFSTLFGNPETLREVSAIDPGGRCHQHQHALGRSLHAADQ